MKTDKELIVIALNVERKKIMKHIDASLKEYTELADNRDLTLYELSKIASDFNDYHAQVNEIDARIDELAPTPKFTSDDIPF